MLHNECGVGWLVVVDVIRAGFGFVFFFCVGFDIIIAIVLWSVILSIFLVHYVKYYHR